MLDFEAIQMTVRRSPLAVAQPDHLEKLITKLQSLDLDNLHDLTEFDAIGIAWDMLPKQDRFHILSLAYRQCKPSFGHVTFDSSIKWLDFSLGDRIKLIEVIKRLQIVTVTLLTDALFSEDFVNSYIEAREERQRRDDEELLAVIGGTS